MGLDTGIMNQVSAFTNKYDLERLIPIIRQNTELLEFSSERDKVESFLHMTMPIVFRENSVFEERVYQHMIQLCARFGEKHRDFKIWNEYRHEIFDVARKYKLLLS